MLLKKLTSRLFLILCIILMTACTNDNIHGAMLPNSQEVVVDIESEGVNTDSALSVEETLMEFRSDELWQSHFEKHKGRI